MLIQKSELFKKKIDSIEITDEKITSRGGLSLFVRYLNETGLFPVIKQMFKTLKKSCKGFKIEDMIRQLLCYFVDGTNQHLTRFDELKKDPGYAAAIETAQKDMCSSHQVKRFFKKLGRGRIHQLRQLLQKIFLWRLNSQKPDTIYIMVDSMVMDNSDAKNREGVSPTYKKGVCGFQPLHFLWNGLFIDLVFRGGKRHCNHGDTVSKAIHYLVSKIRKQYSKDVAIIFLFDSGFFDDKLFTFLENLGVGYIASGKFFSWQKTVLYLSLEETFKEYSNKNTVWKYKDFSYQCNNWERPRNAIYTVPLHDETGQFIMEFNRKESIILYHLPSKNYSFEKIIELHHSRGKHELCHRNIKEFGTEVMPFEKFKYNSAYYNFMVVSFDLFYSFLEDTVIGIIPQIKKGSYPSTARRIIIDFAAKIVTHAKRTVLKVSRSIADTLNIFEVWRRCNSPPLKIV